MMESVVQFSPSKRPCVIDINWQSCVFCQVDGGKLMCAADAGMEKAKAAYEARLSLKGQLHLQANIY